MPIIFLKKVLKAVKLRNKWLEALKELNEAELKEYYKLTDVGEEK